MWYNQIWLVVMYGPWIHASARSGKDKAIQNEGLIMDLPKLGHFNPETTQREYAAFKQLFRLLEVASADMPQGNGLFQS